MYKIGLIGGADDIGRSMLYLEYNKAAIVIDCGMEFPEELTSFGVNRIVSYGSYIKNNLSKIKGLFITHIHEDHIGGIRRFMEKFKVPIYSDKLTQDFLKQKHSFKDSVEFRTLSSNSIVDLNGFKVRPFLVEHSTASALGFEIMAPMGNVVVTGDFKLGNSREDAESNLAKWGVTKNPLALIIESTNSNVDGYSSHESDLIDNFKEVINNTKDRLLIITTFASSMGRLRNIVQASQECGRDIFIMGRNMEVATTFLIAQGIIENSRIHFINEDKCSIPDTALVLSTGCQGEPQGGLYKLISKLSSKPKKTVLFSSSVIPGNENSVNKIKIALLKNGFDFIEGASKYHTSGHARKEEMKVVFSELSPTYVIPVHGDYIKQVANKSNAIESGVNEDNVIIVENNSVIKLKKDSFSTESISDTLEYITSNGITKASTIEVKKTMAKNGVFMYSIIGRYIKFTSAGLPDNCKLNRLGRTFVQVFLQECPSRVIEKKDFKEACIEYLIKEMKNESNLPHIEVTCLDPKPVHSKSKCSQNTKKLSVSQKRS